MKSWLTLIAFLAASTLLAAPIKQKEAASNVKSLAFENVVSFSSKRTFGQPKSKNGASSFSKANGRTPTFTATASSLSKTPMKTFRSHFI